ncbi:hypothetical protein BKA63DRAFT_516500 [Paraphoma chrysanthemicola]|nr:hypothetical protein BKA63DRAFT_516500 [Paraphoma chrysanthemicola]
MERSVLCLCGHALGWIGMDWVWVGWIGMGTGMDAVMGMQEGRERRWRGGQGRRAGMWSWRLGWILFEYCLLLMTARICVAIVHNYTIETAARWRFYFWVTYMVTACGGEVSWYVYVAIGARLASCCARDSMGPRLDDITRV